MLWLTFDLLCWLASPQGINLLFAILCFAAASGAPGRVIMALSVPLYLWLALG